MFGLPDLPDIKGAADALVDKVEGAAGAVADGVTGAAQVAGGVAVRGVGVVADLFDIGEADGTDGGSSNWVEWGHEEIRSMLDNTVDPADIDEGARLWSEQSQRDMGIITGLTGDLNGIVSAGWRGAAADAAIGALGPVNAWAESVSETAGQTAQLMGASGSSAEQAQNAVPAPVDHSWGQSITSFAAGGPLGFGVDAVVQDQAQQQARNEAVRVMYSVYSAPINENRAAVPVYPQLTDPTLQPPEPIPIGGPNAGAGLPGPGIPGGGGGGGVPGGAGSYQPPAVAGLQGAPAGVGEGNQVGPAQPGVPQRPGGGLGVGGPGAGGHGSGAAAAAMPFVPPMGAGAGPDERPGRGFRGAGSGAGRPGGVGGRAGGLGGGGGFGPRGSGALGAGAGAAGAGEGRIGTGPSGGAGVVGGGAGGRGGVGGVPMAGAGAGRGQGGEDSEHRRPSYLIEMDDVFNDGRMVAPPVIGEDPPEYYR